MTDILDNNSDTRPFELSQFGAWLLVDGIRERLNWAQDRCWIETLETELNRLEDWSAAHSPWYEAGMFDDLRAELVSAHEYLDREDAEWYASEARKGFRVIEGGVSD